MTTSRPEMLRAARVSDYREWVDPQPPTFDMIGAPGALGMALAGYVQAVSHRLSERGLNADTVSVFAPTPHRPLSASMLLRSPLGPRLRSGWHEELGWWIADSRHLDPSDCAVPRWLGTLVPAAEHAARLLREALPPDEPRHLQQGGSVDRHLTDRSPGARVLRYRGTDEHLLLRRLRQASR